MANPDQRSSSFFALEELNPAVVATITREQLSEEENIEILGKDLIDLVEQRGCRKLIISLQHVTYITSAAIGKLITLHRRMHRKEGQLILCGVLASVMQVLKASNLNEYFTLAADVPAALSQMSPG